jgi:hypothetical protein
MKRQFIPFWSKFCIGHDKWSLVFASFCFFRRLRFDCLLAKFIEKSWLFINVKLCQSFFVATRAAFYRVIELWILVKLIGYLCWTYEVSLCAVESHTLLIKLFARVQVEIQSHSCDSNWWLFVNFPIFFIDLFDLFFLFMLKNWQSQISVDVRVLCWFESFSR